MTAKELAEKIAKSGAVLHGNRVAVAREARIQKTKSGLFLPDTAQERQSFGVIVMKGTECTLPVEIGDSLYVPIYSGVTMRQPVGNDVYMLEVLHTIDVHISWKATGDIELETEGETAKERGGAQARTLRNQW
jgi:chaperonin GroES